MGLPCQWSIHLVWSPLGFYVLPYPACLPRAFRRLAFAFLQTLPHVSTLSRWSLFLLFYATFKLTRITLSSGL